MFSCTGVRGNVGLRVSHPVAVLCECASEFTTCANDLFKVGLSASCVRQADAIVKVWDVVRMVQHAGCRRTKTNRTVGEQGPCGLIFVQLETQMVREMRRWQEAIIGKRHGMVQGQQSEVERTVPPTKRLACLYDWRYDEDGLSKLDARSREQGYQCARCEDERNWPNSLLFCFPMPVYLFFLSTRQRIGNSCSSGETAVN